MRIALPPLFFTLVATTAVAPAPSAAQRVGCELELERTGDYLGDCRGFDEGKGALQLTPDQPVPFSEAPMELPANIRWEGILQIPGWPTMSVEVESAPYEPEPGLVMKTEVAWLLVEEPTVQLDVVAFWFQFDKDAPPTADDLEIIREAESTLYHEDAWDPQGGRRCSPNAERWSFFCALWKGTVHVTGEFHDRQPALQEVRYVIEDVVPERPFQQPLIEYNDLDGMTLGDLHRVLSKAATRIRSKLASAF